MQPIPDAALTQHIAILGKTGSGKTYAAKGVVEHILSEGGRVCIIDPTGAWHGLRSSSTGKSAGFPVVIFGGEHADLPLGGAHGEALAEIIGTAATPAIIDTSSLKTKERVQFFTDFADGILRKNRGPLHLVVDEAHLFAPQGKTMGAAGDMLTAANNMVSLGRSRGLRIILITQRPAKLHKDSLTQVETLVALRLIAPQDRAAVEDWIKDNADQVKGREIISSLAALPTGTGWVWAPEIGVLEKVRFPKIKTFDSSQAPDGSTDGKGPVLAPIDKDAIQGRLEAVAAEAVANDPARLKAEVAKLKRELAAKPSAPADPQAIESAYERGLAEGTARGENRARAALQAAQNRVSDAAGVLADGLASLDSPLPAPRPTIRPVAQRPVSRPVQQPRPHTNGHAKPGAALARAERRILTALAQYPGGRTKNQVAILTGYAVNGGGFNNAISSLRTSGYLIGTGDSLDITDVGLEALGGFDPLPTGTALLDHWLGQLGKAERETLRVVAAAWPDALTKEDIAAQAGYAADGGGFNNAVSRLRTLELVAGRGELRANDNLFE